MFHSNVPAYKGLQSWITSNKANSVCMDAYVCVLEHILIRKIEKWPNFSSITSHMLVKTSCCSTDVNKNVTVGVIQHIPSI